MTEKRSVRIRKYGLACAREEVLCKKKLKEWPGASPEDVACGTGTIVWRKG